MAKNFVLQYLIKYCEKNNLTLNSLALKCGFPYQTIKNIKDGKSFAPATLAILWEKMEIGQQNKDVQKQFLKCYIELHLSSADIEHLISLLE